VLSWSSLKRDSVPAAGTLLRCGALLVLGLAAYWAVRLAWADHLSRSPGLADRERAVRLAPAAASLYERLADRREELGGDPLPDLERAAALDPANAERHMRLGLRAELAGDFPLAERSLLRAAVLSRLYQPRYLLAQYYFRRGNADSFLTWSRAAFESAYGDVSPLLDLCWRTRPDAEWLVQYALPPRPEIARQCLAFLMRRQQMNAAGVLARRISEAAVAADRPALLEYCDRRLAEGLAGDAVGVWNALSRRRLLPDGELDPARGVSLTNGNFDHAPGGRGFDWRVEQLSGAKCVLGGGAMRVAFSGRQPEKCLIAWQYVPVEPGIHYRLRFAAPADGVRWSIFDFSGTEIRGEPGADGPLTFAPLAEVVRLALVYQRPLGSPRLEGTVAITAVRLEREP